MADDLPLPVQRGFDEVFADAFAEAVEEPRRARKEAPDLVKAIQDETIMDIGRF